MTTATIGIMPVFMCEMWNDVKRCYEPLKFVLLECDKYRGINVLLVGIDDASNLSVVLHPNWIVRDWMKSGAYEEITLDCVKELMRKCKHVPKVAKPIWDELLIDY